MTLQVSPATEATEKQSSGPAPQLAYSIHAYPYTEFVLFVNAPVSIVPVNVGGLITTCTTSPALPSGLSISGDDCSISGTPSANSDFALYTVTAGNSTNSSQVVIAISVNPAAEIVSLPAVDYVLSTDGEITPIRGSATGGASLADCGAFGLPAGLALGPECSIMGQPTTPGTHQAFFNAGSGAFGIGDYLMPGFETGDMSQLDEFLVLRFTVVDPVNQPLVSYGGTSFAQLTTLAGSAISSFTPENAGATITSCVSSPALPAGLALSQTDCEISGTPTTAVAPNAYVLTPMHASSAGNALTVNLTVAPASVHAMACQSGTLCVHSNMPSWEQEDPNLLAYVNSQGYHVSSDPGWCGGVSSAMLIDTYIQDVQQFSGFQPTSVPAPYSASDTEYQFIFKTMNLVGTDIQNGGTYVPSSGFGSFFNNCQTMVDYFGGSGPSYDDSPFDSPAEYPNGMPMGWLAISNAAGGHAIVIDGVEGNYFKIFDPWGAVYNSTIANNSGSATITFVNGNSFNDVSVDGGGVSAVNVIQWVWDYVYVSGGPVPYGSTCL